MLKAHALRGRSDGRSAAGRITGIGCYGEPRHVARTLARALSRFGLSSSELCVAWRRLPQQARSAQQTLTVQYTMPGDEAVAMLAQYRRATGFFLSTADGRPRLQVR